MVKYGADPDQLRSLSKTVAKAADQLTQAGTTVTSQLGSTRWQGPDADRFRSQWNSASMSSLRAAVQQLHTAADALQRNAKEQDQASNATGGSIGPGGELAAVGGSFPNEDTIFTGLGLASDGKGVLDDAKTLHDAVNGATDVARAGAGSDLLGAGAVALDAHDLGKRWQGIEDGNMVDFLGGLLDVAGGTLSVGGMVAPEAAAPIAAADLGVAGLNAGLDDLDKDK